MELRWNSLGTAWGLNLLFVYNLRVQARALINRAYYGSSYIKAFVSRIYLFETDRNKQTTVGE